MIVIGLTGSIGMGKSTTARFFAERGAAVHDADATVHELYRGDAVIPIGARFPGVVVDGVVDRTRLAAQLTERPDELAALEAIVHPRVRAAERRFVERVLSRGGKMVVLDIPLLFEAGREQSVDVIVVATASAAIQAERVMARPGMTRARFDVLLSRQMADGEKRRRAHFLVETGRGLDVARRTVEDIMRALSSVAHPM